MRKNLLRIFLALVLMYIAVCGYVFLNQRALIYFPEKDTKQISDYNLDGTEEIFIDGDNGQKLQVWFHKPSNPKMPVVVYFHGNSYNLGWRELRFKELIDRGYGFITFAYPGFSKSDGGPSKEGILNGARKLIKLLEEKGYKTEDSIVFGESLGTGVALEMAVEHQFKGVFLMTPYTSISDRAGEIYWYLPVHYLLKDNFDNTDKIANVNAPILIVHGTRDDVIPHSHSQKLIELANEPKKLIIYDGKGHTNLDIHEMFNEMTEFFIDEQRHANKSSEQ